MINMKMVFILLITVLGAVFFLGGCSSPKAKIQFNRESSFKKEYANKLGRNSSKVKNVNGVIIYKTNDNQNSKSDINFGPHDINFNLPDR